MGHETVRPVAGFVVHPMFTVPWKLFRGVTVRVVDPWLPLKLTGLVADSWKSTIWNTIGDVECERDPPLTATLPVTVTV